MIPDLFIRFRAADKRDRPGYFIILSGPSGVGKNTLLGRVLPKIPSVYYVPSATTRSMRQGESQMNPYVFVSTEEFEDMIRRGELLEWKRIHTNDYYGTHLPTIQYALKNGYDIITDMDVLGCSDARERFPEQVRSIFVVPPSLDELSQRLQTRDNDERKVRQRLERVPLEMGHKDRYEFIIVNDDLEKSVDELERLILRIVDPRPKLTEPAR